MKFAKILLVLLVAFSSLFAADAPKNDQKNEAESIASAILGQYNGLKSFSAKYERVFTQSSTKKKSHDNRVAFRLSFSRRRSAI